MEVLLHCLFFVEVLLRGPKLLWFFVHFCETFSNQDVLSFLEHKIKGVGATPIHSTSSNSPFSMQVSLLTIHSLHTSRLPASVFLFMLAPLQCYPTFSWCSASPTLCLSSPWEPPHHQSLCMVHLFIHPTINPLYHTSFHSANIFLRTLYEPGIVLDAKETKINVIFLKLAGLTIRQNK